MELRRWDEKSEDPRALSEEGVEVWTFCHGTQRYSVSNMGRVYSHVTDALLTPFNNGDGYLAVTLSPRPYEKKTTLVHRLVILAFEGPPPTEEARDVRHVNDPAKTNNTLSNLLYGTRSENMLDVLRHRQEGKEAEGIEKAKAEGKWYGGRTWDTELVELLLVMEAEGRLMVVDVARILAVSEDVVQNILRGRGRSHVTVPERKKQKRRSKIQQAAIMALILEGKNTAEINEALGETLTAQHIHYYRKKIGAQPRDYKKVSVRYWEGRKETG